MATRNLKVSDNVTRKLKEIAASMSGAVEVGFLEGATYPDGTPVASVAFWNEFGSIHSTEDAKGVFTMNVTPARPFFRTMIADESPSWPGKVAALAKSTHNDGPRVLALMGEDIDGALKQSINDFTTPPNAESTIKAKGFNKPLTDTSHMVNSTGYKVEKGDVMQLSQASGNYEVRK